VQRRQFQVRARTQTQRPTELKADRQASFETECLELVFGILASSGLPISRLRQVTDQILDSLKPARRTWNPAHIAFFEELTHVLTHWYLLKGYSDSRGAPRALPLHGRDPSLASLIARVFPRANPEQVLGVLVHLDAVYRVGRLWKPRARNVLFRVPAVGRLHVLSELRHFLRSAAHNLRHPKGKLLQQSASNPGVPEREFAELVARVRERGHEFCFEVDAEMNRLEQSADHSEPRRRAGLGIYMYADPPSGPPATSRRSARQRKRRPP
jgi:hypothetical protein